MIVELPNGQELEFPDNTSPDVMRSAIAKNFPEYAQMYAERQKPTGLNAVAQDIGNSVAGLPGAAYEFATELPGMAWESAKQIGTNPGRAATNLGAGFLEGLKGLANIPSNVAGYLESRDIGRGPVEEFIKGGHIGDTGLEQQVFGEQQPGDALLRGLTSFMSGGGGIGMAQKGLKGLAKRLGGASVYATGQDQDPLQASLLGLLGEGAAKGAQKIGRTSPFTPSSPLNDTELREALALTKGTETGLGDVIENPFLKKTLENRLTDIPFSGAPQSMQRTAQEVTNRGQQIMDKLGAGAETSNVGQSLQEALVKADQEVRSTKTKKFSQLNQEAQKEGVITDRANLRKVARNMQADIHADKDLAHVTDPKLVNLVDKLAEGKTLDEIQGKHVGDRVQKPDEFSLKKTDFLRAELGDRAAEAFDKGNTGLGLFYKRLREAAENDIKQSIEKSGSPKLKGLRDDAFKYYQDHFLEFEDPNIRKFTFGNGDSDLLVSHFLRKSTQNDRSNLLEKLTTKLTPEQKDLVAHRYFSEAMQEGELNPMKFKTLYKKLGNRQKETLFSPAQLKELSNYTKLVQKNTEPLTLMFNPKTGARNTGALPWLTSASGLGAALMTGEPLTGLAVAGAPIIAGRPLTKYLTSEAKRQKIIENIIKSRQKQMLPQKNLAPYVNALIQGQHTYPGQPEGEYDGFR